MLVCEVMGTLIAASPSPDFHLTDLECSFEFADFPAETRSPGDPLCTLRRVANLLTYEPENVLRLLAEAAREQCGADAAGICVDLTGGDFIPILVATGTCESLTGAEVPRAQSGCAVAMTKQRAQRFHVPASWLPVTQPDLAVAQGITVPWRYGEVNGTLWVVTHSYGKTFDPEDYRTLVTLADFTGMAHRNLRQQETMRREMASTASSAMAHTLAHHINNPLQCITNSIYLALHSPETAHRADHLQQASHDLRALSDLVGSLLLLHGPAAGAAIL